MLKWLEAPSKSLGLVGEDVTLDYLVYIEDGNDKYRKLAENGLLKEL